MEGVASRSRPKLQCRQPFGKWKWVAAGRSGLTRGGRARLCESRGQSATLTPALTPALTPHSPVSARARSRTRRHLAPAFHLTGDVRLYRKAEPLQTVATPPHRLFAALPELGYRQTRIHQHRERCVLLVVHSATCSKTARVLRWRPTNSRLATATRDGARSMDTGNAAAKVRNAALRLRPHRGACSKTSRATPTAVTAFGQPE